MILDYQALFSDAQAIAGSGGNQTVVSTNVIDLGQRFSGGLQQMKFRPDLAAGSLPMIRGMRNGTSNGLFCKLSGSLTGGTPTVTFQIKTSDSLSGSALTGDVVVIQSRAYSAAEIATFVPDANGVVTAQPDFFDELPENLLRYVGMSYVIAGTPTGGTLTVTTGLTPTKVQEAF